MLASRSRRGGPWRPRPRPGGRAPRRPAGSRPADAARPARPLQRLSLVLLLLLLLLYHYYYTILYYYYTCCYDYYSLLLLIIIMTSDPLPSVLLPRHAPVPRAQRQHVHPHASTYLRYRRCPQVVSRAAVGGGLGGAGLGWRERERERERESLGLESQVAISMDDGVCRKDGTHPASRSGVPLTSTSGLGCGSR